MFLMTAFLVYPRYREHGEDASKFSGVEGALVNAWGTIGGGSP